MSNYSGDLTPPKGRIAIVASRFNQMITESLVGACKETLARLGVAADQVDQTWVPGSFEIPLTARVLAETDRYSAVICLGCVIRGETDHYEHVAGQAASGLMQASLATGVPIIFGVLTTDSVEQALNRAGLKSGNKGADAALAAVEMVNVLSQIRGSKSEGFGFGAKS